jgi:4'-phosphopantetheinyl transferase
VADPETDLAFNLAHSERRAVYAFATGCELGVDVEAVRPVNDAEGIVRRFFSPAECAEWRALARAERDAAFFRCWTRKEAYIKALGDGLMLPLDGFQVSLRPGEPARLIRARGDAEAARRWTLVALTPGAGYAGALALAESGRQVRESPLLSADEAIAVEQGGGAFPAFVAQFGA